MKFRQSIFLFTALAMIAALVACSSSSHTTPPPAISVTLSGVPATLQTGATAPLTATVANDSANVNWTCAPAGSCGSFSPTSTASGAATVYTAPSAVPSGGTVTVTATTADSAAASASATITINPITVTLAAVTSSLQIGTTTPLTATNNDSANSNVTWTVTCGSPGACGMFSATTTSSGTTTIYTAPLAVPAGDGTVTITATAADPALSSPPSASAPITITNTAGAISVTLGTVPVSLQASTGQAAITAFVTNDPGAGGVNWTVTCSNSGTGACGTFSATQTASGTATDFTAPGTVPAGGSVTVTATAVDSSPTSPVSASATITISGPNTTLANGNYVFSLTGTDANNGPYSVAGVFTVLNGAVTTGEQDFADFGVLIQDTITGGTVSNPGDGNLQVVLDTGDASIGVAGIETLKGTLACSCTALITEFDASATSSGQLDLQNSTVSPSGGYAFEISGLDSGGNPLAIGGILDVSANLDGTGTLVTTDSVFDANDNFSGTTFQHESFGSGSVSVPDASGRVLFTLNPTDTTNFPQIFLAGYVIDDSRIRLVETPDTFGGTTGGSALGQANPGFFTTIAGDNFVFGVSGVDGFGVEQAAGVLTANADFTVSGTLNYNDLTGLVPQLPAPITGGSYTIDPTGRATMTGVTDGTVAGTFNLQLYLTGNGKALAISMDNTDVLGGVGFGQTGGGSFAASSLFGNYALDAGGADAVNELPFFAIGPVTADGIGTFAGFVDLNWLFAPSPGPTFPDAPVTGVFTADPSGVFTGTITGLDVTNCTVFTSTGTGCTADTFTYYLIDNTSSIAIETDPNQLTLGYFDLQQ